MTAEDSWLLITTGFVSMVLGAGMMWAAGRARRHAGLVRLACRLRIGLGRGLGGLRRRAGVLACTSLGTGMIVAAQWAVLVPAGSPQVWLLLGLPAFLAGATVARLLAVAGTLLGRRRARNAFRGRGRPGD